MSIAGVFKAVTGWIKSLFAPKKVDSSANNAYHLRVARDNANIEEAVSRAKEKLAEITKVKQAPSQQQGQENDNGSPVVASKPIPIATNTSNADEKDSSSFGALLFNFSNSFNSTSKPTEAGQDKDLNEKLPSVETNKNLQEATGESINSQPPNPSANQNDQAKKNKSSVRVYRGQFTIFQIITRNSKGEPIQVGYQTYYSPNIFEKNEENRKPAFVGTDESKIIKGFTIAKNISVDTKEQIKNNSQ